MKTERLDDQFCNASGELKNTHVCLAHIYLSGKKGGDMWDCLYAIMDIGNPFVVVIKEMTIHASFNNFCEFES